jgi:hypothetical protein
MGWKSKVQKILMGNHPLGVPQSRRKVIDITDDVTLSVRDSGAIFTTTGADSAADLIVTLPPLADSVGCVYTIIITTDLNTLVVTSDTTDVVTFNNAAATSVGYDEATDVNNAGGGMTMMNDGTNWLCFVHLGDQGQSTVVA